MLTETTNNYKPFTDYLSTIEQFTGKNIVAQWKQYQAYCLPQITQNITQEPKMRLIGLTQDHEEYFTGYERLPTGEYSNQLRFTSLNFLDETQLKAYNEGRSEFLVDRCAAMEHMIGEIILDRNFKVHPADNLPGHPETFVVFQHETSMGNFVIEKAKDTAKKLYLSKMELGPALVKDDGWRTVYQYPPPRSKELNNQGADSPDPAENIQNTNHDSSEIIRPLGDAYTRAEAAAYKGNITKLNFELKVIENLLAKDIANCIADAQASGRIHSDGMIGSEPAVKVISQEVRGRAEKILAPSLGMNMGEIVEGLQTIAEAHKPHNILNKAHPKTQIVSDRKLEGR